MEEIGEWSKERLEAGEARMRGETDEVDKRLEDALIELVQVAAVALHMVEVTLATGGEMGGLT